MIVRIGFRRHGRAGRLARRVVGSCALIAVASGALAVHEYRSARYLRRAAQLQPAFDEWYSGYRIEKARLTAASRAGGEAVASLTSRLAATRSRILELDALAQALLRDDDKRDASDFDFADDPGLGGPEGPAVGAGNGRDLRIAEEAGALSSEVDDRWQQLHVLEEFIESRQLSSAVRPTGRPVAGGYVSSGFGVRIDPFTGRKTEHYGMDFAARRGTPVVAVAAGIVTWAGPRGGYGKLVEIDHGNGRVTRYGHNSKILVHVGQIVTRGQLIARLGETGRATGPNLHFEVRENGKPVDPKPFVRGTGLAGYQGKSPKPKRIDSVSADKAPL
ncbi:MAG TPA: M23 family metallopeptidase [Gammaproteobacteria bacterium]|nr:M23 family metallopeptidase [Gammaproteobacteria bacterium]